MPTRADDPARATLERWLASDHPWLTVVGAPGLGKRRWIERALADADAADVALVDDDHPATARRVIAIGHRRHRHPDEVVVELAPLPRDAALLHAREVARRAGVTLSDDDAAALVERVGGHPQALSLVTRRLTALTVPELLARLDAPPSAGRDPLMHAAGPPWDALRRALDRVVDALPDATRATLATAALFVGCFTVDDLSDIGRADALAAVQTLRDHSVLARDADRGGLRMLPVIRRYARAHLPAPPLEIVARHQLWRAARAAELARLARRGTADAVERIAGAEAELRAAVGSGDGIPDGIPDGMHGIQDGMLDDIRMAYHDMPVPPDGIHDATPPPDATAERRARCDAALALAALYEHRRSIAGQRRIAEAAVGWAAALDDGRRVAAHVAAARASRLAGDPEAARGWLDRVADLAGPDAGGSAVDRFDWCHERCGLASLIGERHDSTRLADATLEAARSLGDPLLEARALINVGVVRHGHDDLDGAVEAYTAARHISRRLGATRLLSISALNVCLADVWRGRLEAARAAGEEARAAFATLGDRRGEGTALNNLGMIALEHDDLETAEARFGAAEACHAAIGFRQHTAYAQMNLAEVALERGDRARHDALVAALEIVNAGHPDAMAAPGPGPLNDRALALHLPRSRVRSALIVGDLDAAEGALALCRARMGDAGVPAEQVEVELLAVELALARDDHRAAQVAWRAAVELAENDRHRARLRLDLLALEIEPPPDAAARLADGLRAMPTSLATRRTLRAIWGRLPRAVRREARARQLAEDGLCLDPPTHEVRLPDGRWVSLDRRRLVWTLLEVLFDADEALAPDAVIAAVWPGEVIQPDAASNRLYNAVALLRKAGLGQWLEREEGGYRLAPSLGRLRLDAAAIERPD